MHELKTIGAALRRIKVPLFVLLAVFWAIGAIFIILGAFTKSKLKLIDLLGNESIYSVALICIGTVVFVVTLLMARFALQENKFGLLMCGVIFTPIFVATFIMGASAFLQRNQVEGFLRDGWTLASDGSRNQLQHFFSVAYISCCGWEIYSHDPSGVLRPGSNCFSSWDPPIESRPVCGPLITQYTQTQLQTVGITGMACGLVGLILGFLMFPILDYFKVHDLSYKKVDDMDMVEILPEPPLPLSRPGSPNLRSRISLLSDEEQ